MILLHVYAEHPHYASRQHPLHRQLRQWQGWFRSQGIQVVHQPTGRDLRYERAIRTYWGRDDLLIVEGDMGPTAPMIQDMQRCRHPVCTQHYWCYFGGGIIAIPPQRHRTLQLVRWPQRWAWYSGLGFLRIRRSWMQAHAPRWPWGTWNGGYQPGLPWGPWPRALDWRLTGWMAGSQGAPIHVHYPDCPHRHRID